MRDRQSRSLNPLRAAALAVVAALAVGACSASASGAGWTYAPEPPPTPVPSAAASASAAPSAAASGEAPSPAASGGQSGSGGGGSAITVTAQNIAFSTQTIDAAAGQPFTINFDNEDAGIPHNIDILDSSGASVFKGDIVTGVTTTTYQVPALQAGTYKFQCDVHPNMTGTVTIK